MNGLDLIIRLEQLGYDETMPVRLEVGGDGAIHEGQVKGVFTESGMIIISGERSE